MKVTQAALYRQFLSSLTRGNNRIERALAQISDGKRVRVASDDPSGARASLELRSRLSSTEGYKRSATVARYDIATIESRLSEAMNLLIAARNTALAGASGFSENGNEVRGDSIENNRNDLIVLANTFQNGRYLFAGTDVLEPPFDDTGTYQGNSDLVRAPIDRNQTVDVTLAGDTAFQGGGDVFATLESLATALRADDAAAIEALVPDLTAQIAHLSKIRSRLGTRMEQIDETVLRLGDEQVQLQIRIGEIENVDLARAATDLAAANNSVEATSRAAATVLGRSLFDYLG